MNTDNNNQGGPLTPEEEREIQRGYDHLVSGEKQPQYRCRRCGERVNMVKKTCGCTQSPSPWELERPFDTPPQPAHEKPQINYSVSWTEGVINLSENESLEGASIWVLKVGDRTILHAVQQSPIHEAVSAEDRRLIGQAVADALSANSAIEVHSKETMDEVRWALKSGLKVAEHCNLNATAYIREMNAALAKLNPPQ